MPSTDTVPTSQRNLQTVQGIYQAFGAGDVGAIIPHIAPGARWEQWAANSAQAASVPWLAPRTGPEGAAAFFAVVGGDRDGHEVDEASSLGRAADERDDGHEHQARQDFEALHGKGSRGGMDGRGLVDLWNLERIRDDAFQHRGPRS